MNDAKYSTASNLDGVEAECVLPPCVEVVCGAEAVADIGETEEHAVKAEFVSTQDKSECQTEAIFTRNPLDDQYLNAEHTITESTHGISESQFETGIASDPHEDRVNVHTEQGGHQTLLDLPSSSHYDDDEPEDIELKNVLALENVLKSMHPGAGSKEGCENSLPLENELERVMQLENVLRRVNGNLSEFKLVDDALRKITLDDDYDGNAVTSDGHHGGDQMSDIELALKNDPLILNDDFRGSFSTIEEWASSQLKQQHDQGTSRALPNDSSSFSLKSEGEVTRSAKILFAKKTKTLFRWMHPKDSKADLRQRVDRAWDSLSPHEIEYYYSQVLGPFNHRQVKPMINPRIYELLNIPEDRRPSSSTGNDADAEVTDSSSQKTSDGPKTSRSRRTPRTTVASVGLPRRKRGPYRKTMQQALENSAVSKKRKKETSSSSSSSGLEGSDQEYLPSGSAKRKKNMKKKKKKTTTKMGKLRLKFFKMTTITKLPDSSESDDYNTEEEGDKESMNPYKRRFGGISLPKETEISAELKQGLAECDRLLDSDSSM